MKLSLNIKRLLFALVLLVLCLPLLQSHLHIAKTRPLEGAIQVVEKPKFDTKTWLNSKFQTKTAAYYNENFGLRSFLVRWNNQIRYWLLGDINAKGVVQGKNGYLYEYGYIETLKGGDFVGKTEIDKNINKLARLRDTLQQRGVDIVVLFAAGKGYYMPENIANHYRPDERNLSNFDYYTQQIAKTNIPYIDCNRWFRAMKDTTTYPLFPKTGTHWTKYADILVADSLTRFIGQLRDIKTPKIKVYDMEYPAAPRKRDNDIEQGMNLWYPLPYLDLAYPKYKIEQPKGSRRPKVLTISDSFYWGLYNEGFQSKLFDGEFWYYNTEIYPASEGRKRVAKLKNIQAELESQEVIVLISTDTNLERFPYGFLGMASEVYFGTGNAFDKRVQYYVRQIKDSENWMDAMRDKAQASGKSLDTVILDDATYMAKQEKK